MPDKRAWSRYVRQTTDGDAVIDIDGQITAAPRTSSWMPITQATNGGARPVAAQLHQPRLHEQLGDRAARYPARPHQTQGAASAAFGLSDHYREIFSLTRLDEAIAIHDDAAAALAATRA